VICNADKLSKFRGKCVAFIYLPVITKNSRLLSVTVANHMRIMCLAVFERHGVLLEKKIDVTKQSFMKITNKMYYID
jgi:hypothetical protein